MASFAVNIYPKNGQTSESVGESLECFQILIFFSFSTSGFNLFFGPRLFAKIK